MVGAVQDKFASGVYYNTLVDWGDRRIKYGVVSTARLQEDLHGWTDLYIAGRMHKPVTIANAGTVILLHPLSF